MRTWFGQRQVYMTAPAASTCCSCWDSKFKRILFLSTSHSLAHLSTNSPQIQHLSRRRLQRAPQHDWPHIDQKHVDGFFSQWTEDHYVSLPVWGRSANNTGCQWLPSQCDSNTAPPKCFLFLCCLIIILCVSSVNGWWWICKCPIREQHGW